MSEARRLFMIAGEPSGDQLGAGLILALRKKADISFHGIGGLAMAEQGFVSLFPMRDLTIFGAAELLPHALRIKRRIRETVAAIEACQPEALVTIDSPGFANRVIAALRKRGKVSCKFIHYVAPTVWAYKPERAAMVAKLYDHLMVLLPFEQPYFAKVGLPTSFVGHPIVDDLDTCFATAKPAAQRPVNQLRLCLLAGSRHGEIARFLPIYQKTVELLQPFYPDLSIVMPVNDDLADEITRATADWAVRPRIVTGIAERYLAFQDSDLALAKSGTITLEVAKCGLPMVVTYRVHPLTAWMVKHSLKTKFFNLINVIQGREVIPELIQQDCTPAKLAAALRMLADQPQTAEAQKTASHDALRRMRAKNGHASVLTAEVVLSLIKQRPI